MDDTPTIRGGGSHLYQRSRLNLLAPTCLAQQERHRAEPKTDRIQAGELVVLRWPYDARGSQNDVEIDWSGRLDGTKLKVYATRADCETGPNREAGFTEQLPDPGFGRHWR